MNLALLTTEVTTLVSRIIVQVGIKLQVGKISKINKSAGWNKAMQVGILGNLLLYFTMYITLSYQNYHFKARMSIMD